MKKTLSILLIVTMLLSMFAMAIPTFATTGSATVDNTKTPGHADYDHVTKAEFAVALNIDETAVNVITNYTEYCAIESGADADNIKYYLVDLSADADGVLDLTKANSGVAHASRAVSNIYIDFNGYSVNVAGYNNALFDSVSNVTIKNLKLVGTLYSVTAAWKAGDSYYDYTNANYGYSPIAAIGDNSNGVVHLDNIISDVDMIVMQQHGTDKNIGGVIGNAAGGSTFKNIVFDGSITGDTDEAAVSAGKSGVAKFGETGGIVGHVNGNATFENCINNGAIDFDDTTVVTDGSKNFGGIAGLINGNATLKNCENTGDIDASKLTNGSDADPSIGGLVGQVKGTTALEGCTNRGDLTGMTNTTKNNMACFKHFGGLVGRSTDVISMGYDIESLSGTPVAGEPCYNYGDISVNAIYNDGHQQPVGGLAGSCYAGARAIGCENYGNITISWAGGTSSNEAPYGGIVGNIGASVMYFEDCINEGDLSYIGSAAADASFGGIVGKMSTSSAAEAVLTIKNCINKGDITDGEFMGGMLGFSEGGTKIEIFDCINEGTITANKIGRSNRVPIVGGMVGSSSREILIEDSTNRGAITYSCEQKADTHVPCIGGFVGKSSKKVTIKDSVNDVSGTISVESGATKDAGLVGGFIGYVSNNTDIDNCQNKANITATKGSYHVGGIAGRISGITDIQYSTNGGTITVYVKDTWQMGIGGMVGYSGSWDGDRTSTLRYNVNNGDLVLAEGSNGKTGGIGGMIGRLVSDNMNIEYCINNGDIPTAIKHDAQDNAQAGILAYYQRGRVVENAAAGTIGSTVTIKNCINTGDINGKYTSGIFGTSYYIEANARLKVEIENCVNTGDLTSSWHAGAMSVFGAENTDIIINKCVNTGNLKAVDVCGGLGGWNRNSGSIEVKNSLNAGTNDGPTKADFASNSANTKATFTNNLFTDGQWTAEAFKFADDNNLVASHKATIENEIEVAKALAPTAHKYTAYTWAAMIDAIEEAEEVVDTDVMTFSKSGDVVTATVLRQKAINDACAALVAARTGLVKINDLPKALDGAIKAADEFIAGNKQLYTADTWAAYVNAVNAAKAYQAATDLSTANPADVEAVINDITTAKNALVKGGDIFTAADFAKLDGQEGTFNLMADITITEAVPTFKGVLNGNGHTITLDNTTMFKELNGASVGVISIKGTANGAIFGKAVGEVLVGEMIIEVGGTLDAALFNAADAEASIQVQGAVVLVEKADALVDADCEIEITSVLADLNGGVLSTAEATIKSAYLVGVEAYQADGTEFADLASGAVAYFTNRMGLAGYHLVQVLGVDEYPVIGEFAVNGSNVVAPIDPADLSKGFKNAAYKYEDATPVIPVEPIAPLAPNAAGLQSSITAAEALTEADYTAETWAALKTALDAAKAALTADNQADIDAAKLALDLAVKGLKKPAAAPAPSVNLDAINAAIAAAEAKNAGEYTAATWSAVQTAVLAAKRAKALGDQAAVDAATAALNAAVTALVKQAAPEAPVISKPAVSDPAEEKGCGSVIGGAAVVLTAVVALGAGVSFKKKED